MNLRNLLHRFSPTVKKISGQLPFVPWSVALERLSPATLGYIQQSPDMVRVGEEGDLQLVRFAGTVETWLPRNVELGNDLWYEFCYVYDEHPANGHFYLPRETPIREGDIVIDCGVCEGFFVQQALERGAARVLGIEANPTLIPALERTFAGQKNRVILEQTAVGAFNGSANFNFDPASPAGGKIGTEGFCVPVKTIDQLVVEHCLNRIDFIKMDIEGAEIQALEGALTVLREFRPRLAITTYHRPFDYEAIKAILKGVGYRNFRAKGLTGEGRGSRPLMIHAW